MTNVIYEVVQHDGGWAYRSNGVYSETFASHEAAHRAAERAAREQRAPGETTAISYEEADGHWRQEVAAGDDRPSTEVKD